LGAGLGPIRGRARGKSKDQVVVPDKLSYKKLRKLIEYNHPCDPNTKEKFSIMERINVKNYGAKLVDMCFCYQCFKVV
jgi:hypothetical protein